MALTFLKIFLHDKVSTLKSWKTLNIAIKPGMEYV